MLYLLSQTLFLHFLAQKILYPEGNVSLIPRFIICTVLLLLQSYVCVYIPPPPPSPLPHERLEIYFHSLILQRPPLSLEENEKLRLAMKEERRRNKNAQRNELQGT